MLGTALLNQQNLSEALASLKKATELDANHGGAQNMLGYVALRQGDTDGAIAAFINTFASSHKSPTRRTRWARHSLRRAASRTRKRPSRRRSISSPQFWNAHEGIAFARVYAGDMAGGRDAMMKARAAAPSRNDKIQMEIEMSALAVAQNDTAEALRILDAAAKAPDAQPSEIASVPLRRAQTLVHREPCSRSAGPDCRGHCKRRERTIPSWAVA